MSDDNIEPLQPPPWVQFFKEAVPEILTPVVDAVSELKAEYQVDRDEWIARLDEIEQRLDELTRRIGKIEHQLAKGTET